MIAAVNYANDLYKETQKYCTYSAYKYGVEKVFEYGPDDIDPFFYQKNKSILQQKRGAGYWLWKPYIIYKALNEIKMGDFLFYVDSGSYFVNSVFPLIDGMKQNDDDIISFAIPFLERQWTKKEIFRYFKCENNANITDTCQRIATFIVMKKTARTLAFIEKYLAVSQYSNLITDDLDSAIQDDGFIENRHDQSIFSVLAKLEGLPIYKDPSEYGHQPKLLSESYSMAIFKDVKYKYGAYDQILVLHRKKKVTLYVKLLSLIRSKLPWKIYRGILKIQNKVRLLCKM